MADHPYNRRYVAQTTPLDRSSVVLFRWRPPGRNRLAAEV